MEEASQQDSMAASQISYMIESIIYGIAILAGFCAVIYTIIRFRYQYSRQVILAARLKIFKINLTIADLILLFIYAPTQILWIHTYHWYGGDFLCKTTKAISTFALHLTANMQVLIAADRLYITAHLRDIKQKTGFASNRMICLAWILAIACGLPQFFIFLVHVAPNLKPQCVSLWTMVRVYEYESSFSISGPNDTEGDQRSMKWGFENEVLFKEDIFKFIINNYDILAKVEHVYNFVHIISLYVLPYLIEMLCYGSILILMNRVHKEKDAVRPERSKRIPLFDCPCFGPARSSTSTYNDEIATEMSSIMPGRLSDENLSSDNVEEPSRTSRTFQNGFYTPISVNFEGGALVIKKKHECKPKQAWRSTVAIARRKTRRKAFLMLTMNLIFWAPYCIIGILSAFDERFDHAAYDFLQALVVLNAVSNLLL